MCNVCLFNFQPYSEHEDTQGRLKIVLSAIEKAIQINASETSSFQSSIVSTMIAQKYYH